MAVETNNSPKHTIVQSDPPEANTPTSDDTGHQRPYARQAELECAEDFIKNSQFGAVGQKISPFSKQVKAESARYFPIDVQVYELADGLQKSAITRVIYMRVVTLALFGLFAAYVVLRIASIGTAAPLPAFFIDRLSWLPPMFRPAFDIFVAGIVLILARRAVRWVAVLRIETSIPDVRNRLKGHHQELVFECQRVAHDINIIERTTTWPERAGKSAKVALWYAMRADYLDRYCTIALWKVQTFFEHAEYGFILAKVLVVGVMVWALLWGTRAWSACALVRGGRIEASLALLVFFVVGGYGWLFANRKRNDFIGLAFNAGNSSSARTHYFDAMAVEIKNLAVIAGEGLRR
jgi:hypothetical protein